MKGDNHRNILSPNTFLKLLNPELLFRLSFFKFSIPVQSLQIALIWIQNIIAVNRENRRASNVKKTSLIRFSGEGRPDLFTMGHAEFAIYSTYVAHTHSNQVSLLTTL